MQQNYHLISCTPEPVFDVKESWVENESPSSFLNALDRHGAYYHTEDARTNQPAATCISIFSIPAELLAHIFAFLVTRSKTDWVTPECMLSQLDLGIQSLVRASQVCRFWRDVALNTSSLWATFAVGNYRRDRICLQRSRDSPLRIYMPSTNSPFFVDLSAHFHRLQELHTEITLPTPTAAVSFHLEALYHERRAPLLQSLTVRNRVHYDIITPNPLRSKFTGQFPGLKRLHTVDLAISLTGRYVITGLTHLRLEGSLVGDIRMDVHELLDFLELNPEIQELYVSGALFKQTVDCDAEQTTRSVVPLTFLRKFSLRQFESSDEIAHLLSHLTIPPGVAMDLACSDVNMHSGRLLFPQDLNALGNMQRLTHLHIGFTSRYAEIVSGEDQASSSSFSCDILHRSYSQTHRTSVVSAIADTLPLEDVQELRVSGPRDYWVITEVPAETWRKLFARMPNLTTLHVDRTQHHQQLVSALCAKEPDAAILVPAPCLKNIRFTRDCGLALGSPALCTLVEERATLCGGLHEVVFATTRKGDKLRELCSYLTPLVGSVALCDTV